LDVIKIVDKKKLILCIILLSANAIILPKISESILVSVFLTHTCALILVYMFFKQKYKNALLAYSLIYTIVLVWIFFTGNVLYGILEEILTDNYMKIFTPILMYGSQVILFLLCYIFRIKIKQIYKILLYENIHINYVIITSFLPDFLVSFYFISYNLDNSVFRNIVVIVLVAFLGFVILLFSRIVKKANYINKLNKTLTDKNDELKNIKHDYGLQMSCLFELVEMEKNDDITNLLRSIINNENDTNIIDNSTNSTSLLSLATRHVRSNDINIILDDKANYGLATISEIELYRVIINIVNNAIKAMKNKGTLVAQSFEDFKNIVIVIENDGDKIPEEIIDKIFKPGFTTKNNIDKNHGYGLSIVKDLLKNHNGKIFVESNELITKFTILLPKKNYI
jgi:signal transduction histidine kinase